MTRVVRTRLVLTSSIIRGCLGSCELLVPALIAGGVADQPIDTSTQRVIRVLGARHIAQAALQVAVPRRGVVRLGVAIDALHCASMVAYALSRAEPSHRRLARTDAVIASVFALTGNLALRSRSTSIAGFGTST